MCARFSSSPSLRFPPGPPADAHHLQVVLDGMNGFKGLVKIESFDLPANDPAGGITLTLATSLTNPSSVGVALSQIGFQNFFGSTNIGPVASTGAFDLSPKTTIALPLAGRLVPQSSDQGLADVSTLFNGFIHGVPSDLIVQGDYAGPSDCSWLNNGIKQLGIPVVFPAAQNLQIINAITIPSLTLQFSESDPWNPAFTTTTTSAAFSLPFAFPVDITNLASQIYAADGGAGATKRLAKRADGDFALLDIPGIPVKTDVTARTIQLAFNGVPFASVDNGAFSNFLVDVTDDESKTFTLHGAADTVAGTAIGALNLEDISFSVQTTLLGLQGLNARPATVSDLDVFHGYPDYLQINGQSPLPPPRGGRRPTSPFSHADSKLTHVPFSQSTRICTTRPTSRSARATSPSASSSSRSRSARPTSTTSSSSRARTTSRRPCTTSRAAAPLRLPASSSLRTTSRPSTATRSSRARTTRRRLPRSRRRSRRSSSTR